MTDLDFEARLARGPLRVNSVWSPGSPERIARRILRRRRMWFGLDAVAVCACVAVVIGLSTQRSAPTVAALGAGGTASVAAVSDRANDANDSIEANGGRVTAFSDGSVAESSSRDTELLVEQETPKRVIAKLKGGAHFHVLHNPARTFEVRAGDVRVRVLGTIFSVQQLRSGLTEVVVERGRVEVAWLGGITYLESGQGGDRKSVV